MNILEARELEYTYPDGSVALRGVSVALPKNKRVAILGANGAGKSTLLLHFIGILRPTRGEVLFRGKPLRYDRRSLLALRQSVGMVFQNPDDQLFAPTVAEDVSFGPRNLGLSGDELKERVERALALAGVEELAQKPPHLLSYGQKKRVAIAGVLAMEPEVLILDEPLAGLDPEGKRSFVELLDELAERKTIAVATHDVDFAYEWADYIYVLQQGKVVAEGGAKQIFQDLRGLSLSPPRLLEVYGALAEQGFAQQGAQPGSVHELVECVASLGVRIAVPRSEVKPGDEVSLLAEKGRVLASPRRDGSSGGRVIKLLGEGAVVAANGVSSRGEIYLYPCESSSAREIERVVAEHRIDYIAPLGSEAQELAHGCGAELLRSPALEYGMLKALAGYRVLLLLPEGRLDATIKKLCNRLSGKVGVKILRDEG